MLNALRPLILAWLLASLLATNPARPADLEVAAAQGTGADVDAFLEPWRRVRLAHLIPDHARTCVPVTVWTPATAAQRELAAGLDLVAQSPLGAWLIGQAARRLVLLCHDPNTDLAAYYRAPVRLIGVLTRLSEPAKIMFLAHELAHVPQHPEFSNDRRFGPAGMLLMHRVREAAAEAIATRVLWQLRERAYPEIWDHKLRSSYGDVARAFAQAIGERDGEAAELGATRAAFDQWFESPARLRQYDDYMLDHLERTLRKRSGPASPRRFLTDAFLRGIGAHAGVTFLPAGSGRLLTDFHYAGRLSDDNAPRLDAILKGNVTAPGIP
jgi:hypothetical protein